MTLLILQKKGKNISIWILLTGKTIGIFNDYYAIYVFTLCLLLFEKFQFLKNLPNYKRLPLKIFI